VCPPSHRHRVEPATVANFGFPDRRGFELGGYQIWTGPHSFLEPGTGEAIVAESIKRFDQLHVVLVETVP
jgi:hypothetical protein